MGELDLYQYITIVILYLCHALFHMCTHVYTCVSLQVYIIRVHTY